MLDLVSVIIPVYNSSEYINDLIESLKNQTYKNLEIIFVNDGSQDNSYELIKKFTKEDDRIIILNKENGGVSSARNLGLSIARGKYVYFCDADDILNSELIDDLVKIMERDCADIVSVGFEKFWGVLQRLQDDERQNSIVSFSGVNINDAYSLILQDNGYGGYLWNKLFKRDIIIKGKLHFYESIHVLEDCLFILQYIKLSNKFVFYDRKLYYYRQHVGSALNSAITDRRLSCIRGRELIYVFCKTEGLVDRKLEWRMLITTCLYSFIAILSSGKQVDREKWLRIIVRIFSQYHKEYDFRSKNIKEKVYYALLCYYCKRNKENALLVTIVSNNYGNRLQNYALQSLLEKYNLRVRTLSLNNRRWLNNGKNFVKSIVKRNKFDYFSSFNLKIKWYCALTKEKIKRFNYYIVGSDQVWNPNLNGVDLQVNMLNFTTSIEKIAIAPSISCPKLTDGEELVFKEGLKEFKVLSCRETDGAEIIEKITGRKCKVLIDPTLMLTAKEWKKISRKPKISIGRQYILVYFLGKRSQKVNKFLSIISSQYRLSIISVNSTCDDASEKIGPLEFIWLVENCSIMVTDSFHGLVFSYIFDKPFRVFKRDDNLPSMNSRIKSIINLLHLNQSRVYENTNEISQVLECNYDKRFLTLEQMKFYYFLNNAFNEECDEDLLGGNANGVK